MTDSKHLAELETELRLREKELDHAREQKELQRIKDKITILRDEIKIERWHCSQRKIRVNESELSCQDN